MPIGTMGVALLCLQALTVLLVSVVRTAATENDVTPRLTFPYSESCRCLCVAVLQYLSDDVCVFFFPNFQLYFQP